MNYIFGYVKRNGEQRENVKTVGNTHTDLQGPISVTRKYTDSYMTDNFEIGEHYRTDEVEDNGETICYDWYTIYNHYRYEDKFTPQRGEVEAEITENEQAILDVAELIDENSQAILDLAEAIGG